MSTITQTGFAPKANILRGLVERFLKYRLYRATLNELQGLSARELDDLGLHRSQLRAVAYESTYRA